MVREWYWSRSISKKEGESHGCMRGMFHFFDFHHLLFNGACRTPTAVTSPPATEMQYQYLQEQRRRHHAAQCKGVEAPRNSLEFEDSEAAIREDYYGVPISIQISHPSAMARKKKELLLEEENRKYQAVTPRTPSIVARLMGLETLHDDVSSPSYEPASMVSFSAPILAGDKESSTEKIKKPTKKPQPIQESKKDSPSPRRPLGNLNSNISGSISLPDTPRASSEGPRDTDPRRSLQHNNENSSGYTLQELSFLRELMPAASSTLLGNPKKSHYPYQEENNRSPRNQRFGRAIAEEMKSNIHKKDGSFGFKNGDAAIVPSRKNKPPEKKYNRNNQLKPARAVLRPPPESIKKAAQHPSRVQLDAKTAAMVPKKCGKTSNYDRFTEKVTRQLPHLTVFCQQPAKTEQKPLMSHFNAEKEDPEFRYVKAILARADVAGDKTVNWFSASLPIDPTIFHILELWFPFFEPVSHEGNKIDEGSATRLGPLGHRWNRKLLFHLVEEILGDLLVREPKRWRRRIDGRLLLSRIWSEIKRIPSVDCRVVGDIDALVGGDLPESKVRRILRHPSVVAEVQWMASEIQRDILDSLLGDTAASLLLVSSFAAPKAGS